MTPALLRQGLWLTVIACGAVALCLARVEAQQPAPTVSRDPAGRVERARDLTAHGQRLVAAGDPGSAVWYLREALRVEPAFAPAAVVLADLYLGRGEASTALDVLHAAVTRAPGHAALWLRLSRVLWSLNAESDAVEALREGLRRDPSDADLLRELTQRSLQRGEWLRALSASRALQALHVEGVEAAQENDAEEALRVLVGTSDRARGLRCDAALSSVRRALCGCDPAR
jgi:predicted Zn-dependent protease